MLLLSISLGRRYDDVYTASEQLSLLTFLKGERKRGAQNALSGESYANLKNGREVVQYGFHYDFRAPGSITARPVEPLPTELAELVGRALSRARHYECGAGAQLGHHQLLLRADGTHHATRRLEGVRADTLRALAGERYAHPLRQRVEGPGVPAYTILDVRRL